MSIYATLAGVSPRVGGRAITSSTVPSSTDVQAWLDQSEAQLSGLLQAFGITWSYAVNSVGALTIQGWVESYVGGVVRRSWAAMAGSANDHDGEVEIQAWEKLLYQIRSEPEVYGALLNGGSSTTPEKFAAINTPGDIPTSDGGPYWRLDKLKPDSQL